MSSVSQTIIFPSILKSPPSLTRGSTITQSNLPAGSSIVSLPKILHQDRTLSL
jgi:hypothetical protein